MQLTGSYVSSSSISTTCANGAVVTVAARSASTSSVVPGSCDTTIRSHCRYQSQGDPPGCGHLLCLLKWQAKEIDTRRNHPGGEEVAFFCEFYEFDPVDDLPDHAVGRAARAHPPGKCTRPRPKALPFAGYRALAPGTFERGLLSFRPVSGRGYGCLSPARP